MGRRAAGEDAELAAARSRGKALRYEAGRAWSVGIAGDASGERDGTRSSDWDDAGNEVWDLRAAK